MSLRRPTVALLSFTFNISPLCDVASDVRLWRALSFIFHYKPFMWCRLDARLRHCYFICTLPRSHSDTRLAFSITLGFWEDYRPTSVLFPMHCYLIVWVRLSICSHASCLHLLYLRSELSCEYFHSTHLACWFGQMLTKAISWMKSLIVSPTPRGVPVSPVRSWILVTCIIYASATLNKYPRASLRRSKSC